MSQDKTETIVPLRSEHFIQTFIREETLNKPFQIFPNQNQEQIYKTT